MHFLSNLISAIVLDIFSASAKIHENMLLELVSKVYQKIRLLVFLTIKV